MKTKEEYAQEILKLFSDTEPEIVDKVAQDRVDIAKKAAKSEAAFKARKQFKDEQEVEFYEYTTKYKDVYRTLDRKSRRIINYTILDTENIEQLKTIISMSPEEILAIAKKE